MANLLPIWLALHISVLLTSILTLFTIFTSYPFQTFANLSIIALYSLCLFNEMSNVQQKSMIPSLLLKNYSFHILTMTAFFQIFNSKPIQWYFAFGFASFYQLLNFVLVKFPNSQNKIIGFMRTIYAKLTNPPIAFMLLAMFEIMTITGAGQRGSPVKSLIGSLVYSVWFLMYRYEFEQNHRLIWQQLKAKIQELAAKCPQIIQKILYPLSTFLEPMAALAHKIYGNKAQPQ